MNLTDFLTIFAIILGPILAVQAQKWIEKHQAETNRKLYIFKTLMATRSIAGRVSSDHVTALNMIDIEFYKEKEITDTWKCYLDCLNQPESENALNTWAKERDGLFVDLLKKMAKSLGYDFDPVHLKKAVYLPKAHSEAHESLFNSNSVINLKIYSALLFGLLFSIQIPQSFFPSSLIINPFYIAISIAF